MVSYVYTIVAKFELHIHGPIHQMSLTFISYDLAKPTVMMIVNVEVDLCVTNEMVRKMSQDVLGRKILMQIPTMFV